MTSRSFSSAKLLDDLQTALAHGTVAKRVETLRRVTDLFIENAVEYTDAQIAVFDDVFDCLIAHMEASSRTLLAKRLAPLPSAPPRVVRTLAFDDLIEVAAPMLSHSERLDDHALIENASTKSQDHLLAISVRSTLSGAVTDVLVQRGNDTVVKSAVSNEGAEFSEHGYAALLQRAETNDSLATCIGLRPSIPRHHYLRLVSKASAAVRARLSAANPNLSNDVAMAVQDVARRARSAPGVVGDDAAIAHGLVRLLFQDGRLDEHEVTKFAQAGKFDEASAAIACLAHVPVIVAETMMVESRTEGIFILSKVANFSWTTVRAIIAMREKLSGVTLPENPTDRDTFERLRPSTAQQVLRFYRMQQATAGETAA